MNRIVKLIDVEFHVQTEPIADWVTRFDAESVEAANEKRAVHKSRGISLKGRVNVDESSWQVKWTAAVDSSCFKFRWTVPRGKVRHIHDRITQVRI